MVSRPTRKVGETHEIQTAGHLRTQDRTTEFDAADKMQPEAHNTATESAPTLTPPASGCAIIQSLAHRNWSRPNRQREDAWQMNH